MARPYRPIAEFAVTNYRVPADPTQFETPAIRLAWEHWHAKRGANAITLRSAIDPLEMPLLVGNVTLIEVGDGTKRYRIRLHATNVAHPIGVDLTGQTVDGFPVEMRGAIVRAYDAIVDGPHRSVYDQHYCKWEDGEAVLRERLVLPLSRDGATLSHLFAVNVLIRRE
jgi:hypothetical protein